MKIMENFKRIGVDTFALITIVLLMIFVLNDFLPVYA